MYSASATGTLPPHHRPPLANRRPGEGWRVAVAPDADPGFVARHVVDDWRGELRDLRGKGARSLAVCGRVARDTVCLLAGLRAAGWPRRPAEFQEFGGRSCAPPTGSIRRVVNTHRVQARHSVRPAIRHYPINTVGAPAAIAFGPPGLDDRVALTRAAGRPPISTVSAAHRHRAADVRLQAVDERAGVEIGAGPPCRLTGDQHGRAVPARARAACRGSSCRRRARQAVPCAPQLMLTSDAA